MEGADGDVADLSAWLGKPPERTQSAQAVDIEMDSRTSESRYSEVDSEQDSVGITHKQKQEITASEPEVGDSDMLVSGEGEDYDSPEENEGGLSNGFYIEVPRLAPKVLESYEYLPGHFVVERIIQRFTGERYQVKLASGERDLIHASKLRYLENGASFLKAFNRNAMVSRSSRSHRKPQARGIVDWSNASIADSEDSTKAQETKRSRRSKRIASRDKSEDDAAQETASSDQDAESDFSDVGVRRSLRTKAKKSLKYASGFPDLSDGSDTTPRRSGRPKRGQQRQLSQQDLRTSRRTQRSIRSEKADEAFQKANVGSRRSERTRTLPKRSMREKQEDEISAASEEDAGPRVIGTKEVFSRLPTNDPFRQRHRVECDICQYAGDQDAKGPLVFCQGCTNAYHKGCLGPRGSRDHLVTKIGENNFILQCRRCLGRAQLRDPLAPNQGACVHCGEPGTLSKPLRERLTTRQEQSQREENGGRDPITIVEPGLPNNIANVMFRCATCARAWHMHHMPKRVTAHTDLDELDDDDLSEIELAQRRFEFYSHSWICKDCVENQSTIDALVAWRPANLDKYIPGCTVDRMKEDQKEYLLKWRNQSYFRTQWMPGSWVWSIAAGPMRASFMKKDENMLPKMTTKDAVPEDFFRIDIVFEVRYSSVVRNSTKEIDLLRVKEVETAYVKYKGLGYDDAIWETPPRYDDRERFEDYRLAYEDFVRKKHISIPPQTTLGRHLKAISNADFQTAVMQKVQPSIMTGGEMMGYQLEGLNWLLYQWQINKNAILADEMGLGKTIQLIAFFATLVQNHKCWPFLVVVPNSTCPNWRREIQKWVPSLRVVCYYGSSQARKLVRDYELFPKDKNDPEPRKDVKGKAKDIKAHIVVTSYEAAVETKLDLIKVPWRGLVVDEGQRLKNDKGLLYETLTKFNFPFKVLLTGTPLQNNARELFNLLAFIDRTKNAAELEAKYDTLTDENVPELHDLIRPFFLRRTKVQVLTFLPPVAQIILPVTMSVLQKKIYKSILARNPELMKSIFSRDGPVAAKERHNLNNILMQLRKTLCHPFVYSREIEERGLRPDVTHRNLVDASSKLQLLSIMLPKLKDRGHRVLIFSQFLANLDIVEDFLDGLGLLHRRLDGTINALEKQKRIDDFNAPDSPYFAFLLSTRAGGVGINLATADTVIIMDPDFNPHQDIQALSRAHRIGQKNKVLVFQMMTRGSAEEKIMQIAKKKMALDHILIQQMDVDEEAGVHLESILRFGAEALFDDDTSGDIVYDSASADKLLDRSQAESTRIGDDKSAESQFSFARIWANKKAALEDGLQDSGATTPVNPGLWDKILQEREQAFAEEAARKAETLGRGKRKRQAVDYGAQDGIDADLLSSPHRDRKDHEASDTDFQARDVESEENDSIDTAEDTNIGALSSVPEEPKRPTVKAKLFKRVKVPAGLAPQFNGDATAEDIPTQMPPSHQCSACGEYHPMGWCRLKVAGVEYCGLCGLAHLGHDRTCPHLNSEAQVATMLGTLKESTESRDLVEAATKYLRQIRGDLVQRKRNQEKRLQEAAERARTEALPSGMVAAVPPTANGATGQVWGGAQMNEY